MSSSGRKRADDEDEHFSMVLNKIIEHLLMLYYITKRNRYVV